MFFFFDLFLAFLVILPIVNRQGNIVALSLLRATDKQNHERVAILAEVNAVAGTEINFCIQIRPIRNQREKTNETASYKSPNMRLRFPII